MDNSHDHQCRRQEKKRGRENPQADRRGPLCAAAAIHRGPSTAAMLNSSTSQNPITRRNWDFGSPVCGPGGAEGSGSRGGVQRGNQFILREKIAQERILGILEVRPTCRKIPRGLLAGRSCGRPAFSPGACRASLRSKSCAMFAFSFAIRSLMCAAINGSTMVVGSSYRIASGSSANARAIATARFAPVLRSEGSDPQIRRLPASPAIPSTRRVDFFRHLRCRRGSPAETPHFPPQSANRKARPD